MLLNQISIIIFSICYTRDLSLHIYKSRILLIFFNCLFTRPGGSSGKVAPSTRPECTFPSEYQGNWTLFENSDTENMEINGGMMSFHRKGSFMCKGKHWERRNLYKMLSVFQNGW